MGYCNRIALINRTIISLPGFSLLQIIIWFVKQRKISPIIQQTVQSLFRNVNFIDHHVIIVGILCTDDNSKFIKQSNL